MRWFMGIPLLLLVLVGCMGDDDDDRITNETTQSAPSATEAEPTTTVASEAESTSTTEPAVAESIATETPASTPTEEPTATTEPTASPTEPPAEPNLQVGTWRLVQSEFGSTAYVMGDVRNEAEGGAQDVQVVITLLDASGAVVTSGSAQQVLPFVPSQGKSPFLATFTETAVDSIADVQFQIQFEPYDESSYFVESYTASFEEVQVQWTADRITGQIENTGDTDASLVSVLVIGYTTEGEVFGVERTYVDFDVMSSGMTAPFTINLFSTVYDGLPASVEVYASGFAE